MRRNEQTKCSMGPTVAQQDRAMQRLLARSEGKKKPAVEKVDRKAVLDAMPTNWVDGLLTGPKAALPGGYVYGPRDIEKLLLAIRERVLALPTLT